MRGVRAGALAYHGRWTSWKVELEGWEGGRGDLSSRRAAKSREVGGRLEAEGV